MVHVRVDPSGRCARFLFAEMHHDLPSPYPRLLGKLSRRRSLIWMSRGQSQFTNQSTIDNR
jgi:hypothetical protein